ncbi:pyridoxamine 5'-phosphate oxidase family protein [Priestia endophytica]|uniref:pyridoxamine 5'-phosphate oxidase family protein n=1 Tax=Priestia endophytica TaxID=135735 RepID=UPI000F51E54A|nr:pyridoxamine 5'-phosphate oxidase family protein [Priestia endophytica]RPK09376.1 hypothetical protein FH5_04239 [Priestia endophytica]
MTLLFSQKVKTEGELLSLIGEPNEMARKKVINCIDQHCRDFIAQSPFIILSSSSGSCCDASPRGDAPGFVSVLDNNHLLIPERRGNKRMDSLRNILKNPYVGLLFLIPGMGETLRVNGKATLVKDEELLKQLEVEGKVPLIGILVEVEECFIHCAKAFKRSSLWEPEHWPEKYPSAAKMLAHHVKLPNATEESIQKSLQEGYEKRLY